MVKKVRTTPMATNTYSAGSVPVPAGPARPVKVRPTTPKEIESAKASQLYGRRARVRRAGFEAAGGRPGRADVLPDTPVGHGMSLNDFSAQGMMAHGVTPAHTLDVVRGTSMMADPNHVGTAQAGSGEKVPRTLAQGTPNINEPHRTADNVVPARRWEDLHPTEQKKALQRVTQFGTTPEKMHADLRDQVLSAHARSGRNGVAVPFSSRFYEGPSLQHEKIEQGADEVVAHPAFQATGLSRDHARAMVVTANAATSPNVKFQSGDRFPNHEAAMHSIRHALNGGSPEDVGRPEGVGGVYPLNLEKASHLAKQMLGGREVRDLQLPSGKPAFAPGEAPKTTDYNAAWTDPTGPDSRYVSDVHSTHSLMPHLSTTKAIVHELPDGSRVALHPFDKVPRGAKPLMETKTNSDTGKTTTKVKTSGSESEQYLAGNKAGLSALHDHIARNVAHELGLSHSVDNAGATHFTQATDWGEEQITRPDVHDRTEKTAYGRDPRVPAASHDIQMRTPASGEVVTQHPSFGDTTSPFRTTRHGESPSASRSEHFRTAAAPPLQSVQHEDEDHTWGMGDQKRHENTERKIRRQGPRMAERTAGVDPNYRAPAGQW